jgi:hypothetical protein
MANGYNAAVEEMKCGRIQCTNSKGGGVSANHSDCAWLE